MFQERLLYTADILSRAPLKEVSHQNNGSSEEIEQFVQAIVANFPANQDRLDTYRTAQAKTPFAQNSSDIAPQDGLLETSFQES